MYKCLYLFTIETYFTNVISKAATMKKIDQLHHIKKPKLLYRKKKRNPKRKMTNWENISNIGDKILVTLVHKICEYKNKQKQN